MVPPREADQLGKAPALRANADGDLMEVVAVLSRVVLAQTARVDPEDHQQELEILGPPLSDDRDADARVLVAMLAPDRYIAVGLEHTLQVGADLVVRRGP